LCSHSCPFCNGTQTLGSGTRPWSNNHSITYPSCGGNGFGHSTEWKTTTDTGTTHVSRSSTMSIPLSHTQVYRQVLREIAQAVSEILFCFPYFLIFNAPLQSKSPRATRNKTITSSLRAIIAKPRQDDKDRQLFNHDIQNVIAFMRSQREHKVCCFPLRSKTLSDMYVVEID
jgi:hypothetical protein